MWKTPSGLRAEGLDAGNQLGVDPIRLGTCAPTGRENLCLSGGNCRERLPAVSRAAHGWPHHFTRKGSKPNGQEDGLGLREPVREAACPP